MERNVRLERWLTKEARRLMGGCRVLAFDGVTQCYTPDATGKYGGLWIRDFYFLAEAVEFFQKDGIYEAVNDVPKYRGAKDYVISAALRQSMKWK